MKKIILFSVPVLIIISIIYFWLIPSLKDNYYIGVSLPLSGEKQKSGENILNALKLKVDEINSQGGINSRKIELIVKDDANDPELGKKNAKELSDDKRILAVIGHFYDKVAIPACDIYDKAGVVIYSPSVSNPEFFRKSKWAFSGSFNDNYQIETMCAYMKTFFNISRILVINSNDPYGTFWKNCFIKNINKLNVSTDTITYDENVDFLSDDYIKQNLEHIRDKKFDGVAVFGGPRKGSQVIKQIRDYGFKVPIFGSERISDGLIQRLGNNTSDIYISFPYLYDLGTMVSNDFMTKYTNVFKEEPSIYAGFAYDGLGLIVDGIKYLGSKREDIRDYLYTINSEDKATEGASGKLYFDSDGSAQRDVFITSISDGGFVPAFDQLKEVTLKRHINRLEEKIISGEIIVIDSIPYYKIKVVFVGIDPLRLNNVNIQNFNFELEYFMWFKYTGDVDINNIIFLNESEPKPRVELRKNEDTAPFHWISYRAKSTFIYPYDLKLFPFDVQVLPLKLAHKSKNAQKIILVSDKKHLDNTPIKDIYPQEWEYINECHAAGTFRYTSTFGNPTYSQGDIQPDYSVYEVNIKIHRILFPYLITLFLPLTILIIISYILFLIPKADFGQRLGASMTSLLGVLVYHMAQAHSLPSVGYLVFASLYFIVAYILLAFLIINIIIVHRLKENTKLEKKWDKILIITFVSLSIISYAFITIYAIILQHEQLGI